jgi:YegS/Rv2252/BmrU family lipid kinase
MNNSQRHITFIINPVSGTTKKKNIPALIEEVFRNSGIETTIRLTEYAGHAKEIAAELAQAGTGEIIAVGGDGTINEIVNGMAGTEAVLGIIPSGSGNGLARHCKIPVNARKAMEIIKKGFVQKVDLMRINEEYSANVSGVGFDALVAHKFQYSGKRGLAAYAKITLSEFVKYHNAEYTIIIDGAEIKRKAFFVSLANSSQFGNNAFIAPGASITDGLIDVCILHHFPKISSPVIMERVMAKTINNSKYMEIIQGKKIQIKNANGIYHLDGDPRENGDILDIEIMPGILNLIVPENQKI